MTVGPGGATIGRVRNNTWCLSDRQSLLSRTHFEIVFEQGDYQLIDRSTNGTFLDDNETPVGRGNSAPLVHGCRIRLGEYVLEAQIEGAATEEQPELGSIPAFLRPSGESDAAEQPSATEPASGLDSNAAGRPAQILPDDLDLSAPPPGTAGDSSAAPWAAYQGSTPSTSDRVDALLAESPAEPTTPSFGADNSPPPLIPDTPAPSSASPAAPASGGHTAAPAADTGAPLIPDDWFTDAPAAPAPEAAPQAPPVQQDPVPPVDTQVPVESPATGSVQTQAPTPPPPVKAPPGPASASGQDAAALRPILEKALGAHARGLSDQETLNVVEEMAAIMATIVPPLMASLRARSQFKDQLRLNQTMIRPRDNNPLKFCEDQAEALEHILLNDQPGLLNGRQAMQQAMEELAAHQGAMLAALRPALQMTIDSLSPEAIQNHSGATGALNLPFAKSKGKLWDNYVTAYEELNKPGRNGLETQFMNSLANNYEKILDKH